MKLIPLLTSLALLAAAGAQGAQAPLKEVVVTYPPSTPRSVIDEAIARIAAEVGVAPDLNSQAKKCKKITD